MVFITHDLSEALRFSDRIADHARRPVRAGGHAGGGRRRARRTRYVENFVRDVPRSFVVPVEHVMRDVNGDQFCGSVALGTKVRDIVTLIAQSGASGASSRRRRTPGRLRRPGARAVAAIAASTDDAGSPACRRRPQRRGLAPNAHDAVRWRVCPRCRHLQGHPASTFRRGSTCMQQHAQDVPLDHAERPAATRSSTHQSRSAAPSSGASIGRCRRHKPQLTGGCARLRDRLSARRLANGARRRVDVAVALRVPGTSP